MSAGNGILTDILIDPGLRSLRWTAWTGLMLLVLVGAVPEVRSATAHPVAVAALLIAWAATWWRRLDADAAGATAGAGVEPAVLINPKKTGRDYEQMRQHLESVAIESRPLWKPMHTQPVFKDAPAYVNGVSERLFSQGLCLPSGPYVSDEDAMRVVKEVLACRK